MRIFLLLILSLFVSTFIFSQSSSTTYNTKKFHIGKKQIFNPRIARDNYNVNLINHEAPSPSGNSAKSYLLQQKIKSRALYPIKKRGGGEKSVSSADEPIVGEGFGLLRHLPNGTSVILNAGIPNDNSMAVSDSGIVLMGVNSFIYAYDLKKDTSIFPNQSISLSGIVGDPGRYFDPKIIYDKESDRFILVFLRDADPVNSRIVVCFSTTNDPTDDWNVYLLPGNPLDNDRWTDFPAIAITEKDLFITINLIVPDVAWQVGFDGSVIWQIEKETGYNNDSTLNSLAYTDIRHNGKFTRNLHPVQGADGAADEMYLLSNRNFDLTNDSIFLLHVDGDLIDGSTTLTVDVHESDINYGVPPNGRQLDTDLSDPTSGLQTNDARVLGAIKLGDDIQFVSTTVNSETGLAGIYHGTFSSVNDQPSVTAKIIADSTRDFGYPNIAWTGNEECDIETIISFNYTAPTTTDFPGMATVYYDNQGEYSDVKTIKEGESFVDRLNGTAERWGDYFGLQRWYKYPGHVLAFGYYARTGNNNASWCAELIGPDTSQMNLNVEIKDQASLCLQTMTANVTGGIPPYEYEWSNDPNNNSNLTTNVCVDDTVNLAVVDARGCRMERQFVGNLIDLEKDGIAYPNPFSDQLTVQFSLTSPQEVVAEIYDVNGKLVAELLNRKAKEGLNELIFSTFPLSAGEYILRIEAGGKEVVNEKIIKQ